MNGQKVIFLLIGGEIKMWVYEKKLEYPVNIKRRNLKFAKLLTTQFGGANSELVSALRYISHAYTMPTDEGRALMIDIATEELAHVEIINTMIKQLTQGATLEEIKFAGFEPNYTEHGLGIYPSDANGVAFNAVSMASTGDVKADIYEDMAGEQKARATYEHLINLTDDADILEPLYFLRQREVVHFNRFKELLEEYTKKGY